MERIPHALPVLPKFFGSDGDLVVYPKPEFQPRDCSSQLFQAKKGRDPIVTKLKVRFDHLLSEAGNGFFVRFVIVQIDQQMQPTSFDEVHVDQEVGVGASRFAHNLQRRIKRVTDVLASTNLSVVPKLSIEARAR